MDFERLATQSAALLATVMTKSNRNQRGPDELRNDSWWTDGYQNWEQESFKKTFRVSRDTFEFILGKIANLIVKEPTPMKARATPPAAQLALCLCRVAYWCTFGTVGDRFGVSESTAQVMFQDVL